MTDNLPKPNINGISLDSLDFIWGYAGAEGRSYGVSAVFRREGEQCDRLSIYDVFLRFPTETSERKETGITSTIGNSGAVYQVCE